MTPSQPPMLTRRGLLMKAGAVGGSAAVYAVAGALGLMRSGAAHAKDNVLDPMTAPNKPVGVAILGGGIAGLTSAYELGRAGYQVTLLEASHRLGGRNLTARRGTFIDELGSPQTCQFDDHPDLYFNCGPARIPATHQRLLHYCRAFDISLETFINENINAYVQTDGFNGGQPMRQRRYLADARGFLAEMASKVVRTGALDQPVDDGDVENLIGFLNRFGDLNQDHQYQGSMRGGLKAGGSMTPPQPHGRDMRLAELLKTPYWQFPMHFTEGSDGYGDQFAAMFQPVGGMDRIVDAFAGRLKADVRLKAQVTDIRLGEQRGVEIDYLQDGKPAKLTADYCLNNIPGHILNGINNNLPDEHRQMIGKMRPFPLSKIGLQMGRRFWEEEQIYGGISWTADPLLQIWYPSHGHHRQKGVVLGAYVFDFNGPHNADLARLSPQGRIDAALTMGQKLHGPVYRQSYEVGVAVVWHRMNHLLGCGSGYYNNDDYEQLTMQIQAPAKGRHWLIGDQVSYMGGWQEGAIASAHHALRGLEQQVQRDAV